MKIRLLNDYTALSIDDGRDILRVDPPTAGKLTIDRNHYTIEEGGEIPVPHLPNLIGRVGMTFIAADTGIRYTVINPHMRNGVPYTVVDFTRAYFDLMIRADNAERERDNLRQRLLALEGEIKPDALGFLNIGGENHEE